MSSSFATYSIAKLQICQFSLVQLLIRKSGRLYMCMVVCSIVMLATVLMLLWPLKILKLSHFSPVSEVCYFLKITWDTFGILLGYSWDTFGILLGYFWDTFEILLGYFWDSFGILLGYFWDSFGILLGYV